MKRFLMMVSLAFAISFPQRLGAKKKGPDPALQNIHKLFIKGNNEAAANMRKILSGKTGRVDNIMTGHGDQGGCFALVGNEEGADAVMEVSEEMTRGGLEGMTTVVSATITDKQGSLIWSDSKQGVSGIVHTGAGDGARNLAFSLERSAGCR